MKQNNKEKQKRIKNIFILISYIIFVGSIIFFLFSLKFELSPKVIFYKIFEKFQNNIVDTVVLNKFNTHEYYIKYQKEMKSLKSDDEKYNLIISFLKKFKSPYIGFIKPGYGEVIFRKIRGKEEDNLELNENLEGMTYLKIHELWNPESTKIFKDLLLFSEKIILDLRAKPFGYEEYYFSLFSLFLKKGTIWYRDLYVKNEKIELDKFKEGDYKGKLYVLMDKNTIGISLNFITEILDNYYPDYYVIQTDDYTDFVPPKRISYEFFRNHSIFYYPNKGYRDSKEKTFIYINYKDRIKKLNDFPELKEILLKNRIVY